MRFKYRRYKTGSSPADPAVEIDRPALKVHIEGKVSADDYWGLLDTGAEDCTLPIEIGHAIGAEWCGVGRLSGQGGDEDLVRYGRVRLRFEIVKQKVRQVIRWNAIVAFSERREEALWGITHFLEYFRVTFDGAARHFTIHLPSPRPKVIDVKSLRIPQRFRLIRRPGPIHPDDQAP